MLCAANHSQHVDCARDKDANSPLNVTWQQLRHRVNPAPHDRHEWPHDFHPDQGVWNQHGIGFLDDEHPRLRISLTCAQKCILTLGVFAEPGKSPKQLRPSRAAAFVTRATGVAGSGARRPGRGGDKPERDARAHPREHEHAFFS